CIAGSRTLETKIEQGSDEGQGLASQGPCARPCRGTQSLGPTSRAAARGREHSARPNARAVRARKGGHTTCALPAHRYARLVESIVKTRSAAPEVQAFTSSSLPPSPAQRRLALGVVLALMAAFVVAAGPLSTVPLARIDAFVPMYAAAMFVCDSITAVLLFAQFAILRSHALLAISSGYLFTALIIIPWVLTFPGVFAPGGLLGAGLQSGPWLFILWHAGFPLFVLAYALLKSADPSKQRWQGPRSAAILLSAAVPVAAVCAATLLVTAGHALLPSLMRDAVSGAGSLPQYLAG